MSIKPTFEQKDALQKLFNIGVDRANTMLNYLSDKPIRLQMTPIEIVSPQQLHKKLEERIGMAKISAMELLYRGEFDGTAQLVFPTASASLLLDILADEQRRSLDRDAVTMKTLSEVGNIFFNGLMGAFSNILKGGITYMAPSYREGTLKSLLSHESSSTATVLYGKVQFIIEELKVGGNLLLFFQIDPFETLLADIERTSK